jgi:hypothetical protein
MIVSNWIEVVDERFLAYGMSLSTEESVLASKSNEFNQVIRDLKQDYPNKKLWHMILSLKDHYEIEFLVNLLDEENRLQIRSEVASENGLILSKTRKRH